MGGRVIFQEDSDKNHGLLKTSFALFISSMFFFATTEPYDCSNNRSLPITDVKDVSFFLNSH